MYSRRLARCRRWLFRTRIRVWSADLGAFLAVEGRGDAVDLPEALGGGAMPVLGAMLVAIQGEVVWMSWDVVVNLAQVNGV